MQSWYNKEILLLLEYLDERYQVLLFPYLVSPENEISSLSLFLPLVYKYDLSFLIVLLIFCLLFLVLVDFL